MLPEDAEPCPDSIWVTDEYDAIRSGLSRIELPVWRVSWGFDVVKGAWGWVRRVLSARAGGKGDVGVGKRSVKIQDRYVEPEEEDVRQRMDVMREQWGWREGEADLWALSEGRCERPVR